MWSSVLNGFNDLNKVNQGNELSPASKQLVPVVFHSAARSSFQMGNNVEIVEAIVALVEPSDQCNEVAFVMMCIECPT